MINKTMQDAINGQINKKLYSSCLYLSMAAYLDDRNLPGFAHWMRVQEAEERGAGMLRLDHHRLAKHGGEWDNLRP